MLPPPRIHSSPYSDNPGQAPFTIITRHNAPHFVSQPREQPLTIVGNSLAMLVVWLELKRLRKETAGLERTPQKLQTSQSECAPLEHYSAAARLGSTQLGRGK